MSRSGATGWFWVNSDEIVFLERGDPLRIMSATVRDLGTALDVAEPVELFAIPGARGASVSRDGRTFAAVLPVETEDASEAESRADVRLILNWDQVLEE